MLKKVQGAQKRFFFTLSIVSTNMKYCWEHEEEIKHHKFAFPPSHSGILWKFTFYLFFFLLVAPWQENDVQVQVQNLWS